MPGQLPRRGVVGVPSSSASDRTAATELARRRGGFAPAFKIPLKTPLVQRGTLFSSNVTPPDGMRTSPQMQM